LHPLPQAHAPDTGPWLLGLAIMTVGVFIPMAYLYVKAKAGTTGSSRRD
jgi:hypothetical protein